MAHEERTQRDRQSTEAPRLPRDRGTWNSPEQIAEHRSMAPGQRVQKAIELSRAAQRFAQAERVDER